MQRPEGTRVCARLIVRTNTDARARCCRCSSRAATPTKTRMKRMKTTRPLDTRSRSRSEENGGRVWVDRSSMRIGRTGKNTRRNDTRAKQRIFLHGSRYCDSSRRYTCTLFCTPFTPPPPPPPSKRVYPRNVVEFTLVEDRTITLVPRLRRESRKRVPE